MDYQNPAICWVEIIYEPPPVLKATSHQPRAGWTGMKDKDEPDHNPAPNIHGPSLLQERE